MKRIITSFHTQFFGICYGLVLALATILRTWNLAFPRTLLFDEFWYVPQAYFLRQWSAEIDNDTIDMLYRHRTGAYDPSKLDALGTADIAVNTHGPLGKWLMVPGMQMFGWDNSFGWRIMSAVFGVLMVVGVMLLAQQFVGRGWTLLAGLIVAVDGTAVSMSRVAMLDIFLTTFIVFGSWAAVKFVRSCEIAAPDTRRQSLFWLLSTCVLLGLAAGIKLYAVVFIPVFGIWFLVALLRRATATKGRSRFLELMKEGMNYISAGALGFIAAYLLPWVPYLVRYDVPLKKLALIIYESNKGAGMITKHHVEQSAAWTWPFQIKPTVFYSRAVGTPESLTDPVRVIAVTTLGNPVFWLTALVALFLAAYWMLSRRDIKAGAILSLVSAAWLPWFLTGNRPIFHYYAVLMLPFFVLALVYVMSSLRLKSSLRNSHLTRAVFIGWVGCLIASAIYLLPFNMALKMSPQQWLTVSSIPHWHPQLSPLDTWA